MPVLKEIELIAFENHEHTVIRDLSPYFNVFQGDSNIGKTSVFRALMLVSCNEFSPDMVRNGYKNTEVKVTSDIGSVHVIRGKDNIWNITKNGNTETYTNIGRQALPQSQEIMGMYPLSMGDKTMFVNIMDQLESHFMLSQIGGDNASGSVRANVVDEISGIAGIESIIGSVSLDGKRSKKKMGELEKQKGELEEQLHDENDIEEETVFLNNVSGLVEIYDNNTSTVGEMETVLSEWGTEGKYVGDREEALNKFPDLDAIGTVLENSLLSFGDVDDMEYLSAEFISLSESLSEVEKKIGVIPNTKILALCVGKVEKLLESAKAIKDFKDKYNKEMDCIERVGTEINSIGSTKRVAALLSKAEVVFESALSSQRFVRIYEGVSDEYEDFVRDIEKIEGEIEGIEDEYRKMISSIDVCPVTGEFITESCSVFKGDN